jgi:hypothetical protein
MWHLAIFLGTVAFIAGDSALDQRRLHTLERMDWSGGTAEDQRVREVVVAALERANDATLRRPQLINVTMVSFPDGSGRDHVRLNWIAADPDAEGVRIRFSDGPPSDITFAPVEVAYNRQEARDMVLYTNVLFIGRENPDVWSRLRSDEDAAVLLTRGGAVVSNQMMPHRIELGENNGAAADQ